MMKAKRLLYVEDNEDNIFVVERRLSKLGYQVQIARDGREGIEKARASLPDLILMDMQMPVLDGWQATSRLKADPRTAQIPILALTASAMANDRASALAVGCDDFDSKPIDFPRLKSKIEALLSSAPAASMNQAGPASAQRLKPALHSLPILAVDDHPDNLYTLTQRLKRLGYEDIDTASNGVECLAAMARRDYALVLLDVMMPEMDGYQVLEHIAAHDRLRKTAVIMISALDQLGSVVRCIELGAEDYLTKPFDPTQLKARVGAIMDKRRMRDILDAHAQRMEQELAQAHAIQLAMVPMNFPRVSDGANIDMAAELHPAREVGGDLYDYFFTNPHTIWLTCADVAGKGTPAALTMARTKSLLRMAAQLIDTATPAKVLRCVNAELAENNSMAMFVSCVLVQMDLRSGAANCVSAGHPLPVLLREGHAQALNFRSAPPLGASIKARYADEHFCLWPQDALVLYTDGVTESENAAGEQFGMQALEAILSAHRARPVQDVVQQLSAALRDHAQDAAQSDDIAMLALRLHATSPLERQAFELHADNQAWPYVEQYLQDLAVRQHWGRSDAVDVRVLIEECVGNVSRHSFDAATRGDMSLQIDSFSDGLAFTLEDSGKPFNPLAAPRPDLKASLREREIGGLGLELVRSLCTAIHYEYVEPKTRSGVDPTPHDAPFNRLRVWKAWSPI